MRLLMLGTGPFAVPTFESLLESTHDVAALITRPTPPIRGRHKGPINPMRDTAEARGVQHFEPDDINSDEGRQIVASLAAELLVVCDYGQILSAETLSLAPLGGINLHASLLPRYRGAAPINWALLHGERETGVTVIHMTPRLDAGPCLVQKKTEIGMDENAAELEARLARIGAAAVHEAIDMLAAWDRNSSIGVIQDPSLATRAPRLRKEDGEVDWSRTAGQIRNQVRALKPWPGTFTRWLRKDGEPLRVILDAVSVALEDFAGEDESGKSPAPGTVVDAGAKRLQIATGGGVLSIDRIQPAGKRAMEVAEFLRGHRIEPGERFG